MNTSSSTRRLTIVRVFDVQDFFPRRGTEAERRLLSFSLCDYISNCSGYGSSSFGFIGSKTARIGDEEGETVLIYD